MVREKKSGGGGGVPGVKLHKLYVSLIVTHYYAESCTIRYKGCGQDCLAVHVLRDEGEGQVFLPPH